MKIEVRPIIKKQWHGKVGKESFTRPKKLQALVDGSTRLYATGLDNTKRVYNKHPLTGKKIEDKSDYLTEQEYYSALLKVDLSPQYMEDEPHPFWDSSSATIKLENQTMYFDNELPLDYIKIKIMKASKFVANSMKEYEQGLFPEATHVITDEKEEVEVQASKIEMKNSIIIKLAEVSNDVKKNIIMILAGKNLKGASDKFITVEMNKIVDKQPKQLLNYLEREKEDISVHSLILEALQKSVLRKQGHKILYHDSTLGNDVYDVIEYLKQSENQDLKIRIMQQVNDD